MTLRKAALALGVKRKDTCKLFFGIYPYSLTANIPQRFITERQTAEDEYWNALRRAKAQAAKNKTSWKVATKTLRQIRLTFNEKVRAHVEKFLVRNQSVMQPEQFYFTFSAKTFTIYLETEEMTTNLLKSNPKTFVRVTDPFNEKCADFLSKGDPKVLVRQNLFDGVFEFRIEFKKSADYEQLDHRVETLRFCSRSYSYGDKTRTLYLTGEDDLFLARMGLEDHIERITKCVLATEV